MRFTSTLHMGLGRRREAMRLRRLLLEVVRLRRGSLVGLRSRAGFGLWARSVLLLWRRSRLGLRPWLVLRLRSRTWLHRLRSRACLGNWSRLIVGPVLLRHGARLRLVQVGLRLRRPHVRLSGLDAIVIRWDRLSRANVGLPRMWLLWFVGPNDLCGLIRLIGLIRLVGAVVSGLRLSGLRLIVGS